MIARFWEKVDILGPEDCWPWTKGIDDHGYGQFKLDGKNIKSHRVAFMISNGYIPRNVQHSCDNTLCQNPKHLRDGNERGLYTNAQVSQMRELARLGSTKQELVNIYGGNRSNVSNAVTGKTYKYVETPAAHITKRDKDKWKLTVGEIKEIKRALLKPYWGQGTNLGRQYNVSPSLIGCIKNGRIHADVSIDS